MSEACTTAPDPAQAQSAYAEGKRAAELLCALAPQSGSIRPKIARCFAFVGPLLPLDAHFAVGNFLADARAGRDIAVSGDGTPRRSYLHMADLVPWLAAILVRGTPMRPYNVGSDDAISIAELARRVSAASGGRSNVHIAGRPGSAPPEYYVPVIDRARAELGVAVRIGLDDALARTWRWISS